MFSHTPTIIKLAVPLALAATLSCGSSGDESTPTEGANGNNGANALVDLQDILAGDDCPGGGVRVSTGTDLDNDGELSQAEIDAGESTLICNTPSPSRCGDALRITALEGLDQTFVLDQPSAPIRVELNASTDLTLELIGRGFDADLNPGASQFTLTAREVGGPFQLAMVASDGCTLDVASITIPRVETNEAELRAVWAYGPWSPAQLTFGDDPAEVALDLEFEASLPPASLQSGDYTFDVIGGLGESLTTLAPTSLAPGSSTTLISADLDGTFTSVFMPNDRRAPARGMRLAAINMTSTPYDIASLGRETPIFSQLATEVPAESVLLDTFLPRGFALIDGEQRYDFLVDDLASDGVNANLIITESAQGQPRLLAQILDDEGILRAGAPIGTLPESFESEERPQNFCTNFEILPVWATRQGDTTDGDFAMTFNPEGTDRAGGTARLIFEMPEEGQVSFDWRLDGEPTNTLGYCIGGSENTCPFSNSGCFPDDFADTAEVNAGWTTVITEVLPAGPHALTWVYSENGVPPTAGPDPVRIDNLRLIPSNP